MSYQKASPWGKRRVDTHRWATDGEMRKKAAISQSSLGEAVRGTASWTLRRGESMETTPPPDSAQSSAETTGSRWVTNPSSVARFATCGWNTHEANRRIGIIEAATTE